MRRVCSWCKKEFGRKPGPEREITHGICPACYTQFMTEELSTSSPASLAEVLETLGVPVFLTDDDVRVRAANRIAASALGKELEALPGKYGGDVIDCFNAGLPGGCGKTVPCRTCVIRNSITDTYNTGQSHRRLAASREQVTVDGLRAVRFVISTEKVGAGVLLRVDEVVPED